MKIYCGCNKKGVWKASLDETKVDRFDRQFECEVETIHNNKVYMIESYFGFDYDLNRIYDVTSRSNLYHSVTAAKKSDMWKEKEKLVNDNPDQYHVTPFSIASDHYGSPFIYGDVMEGKFNMEIITVRVV